MGRARDWRAQGGSVRRSGGGAGTYSSVRAFANLENLGSRPPLAAILAPTACMASANFSHTRGTPRKSVGFTLPRRAMMPAWEERGVVVCVCVCVCVCVRVCKVRR